MSARSPGHIVLVDAPGERFNLSSAFGNLFPAALLLRAGAGWTGEIVASPADVLPPADFVYRLEGGRLIAEPGRGDP
ncbi:hypothetical protein D3C84_1288420 [compost metagenome]